MAGTHKPSTLTLVENPRAPPYIWFNAARAGPQSGAPAHTGEKATRFPLTAQPSR